MYGGEVNPGGLLVGVKVVEHRPDSIKRAIGGAKRAGSEEGVAARLVTRLPSPASGRAAAQLTRGVGRAEGGVATADDHDHVHGTW